MAESEMADPRPKDLYDRLFVRRDRERQRIAKATAVVKGDELPVELSRQGLLKWYLHPDIADTIIQSLVVYVQDIPPGSRTGSQKHQGEALMFISKGRGFSVIDGERLEWEKGDLIILPARPNGLVHQHFNSDAAQLASFIVARPNVFDALGVDMGCGLEQIEDAPEYQGVK